MHVIPNGFELEKGTLSSYTPNSFGNELGVMHGCWLVIYVGRFNPVKDHKTFIEAGCSSASDCFIYLVSAMMCLSFLGQ